MIACISLKFYTYSVFAVLCIHVLQKLEINPLFQILTPSLSRTDDSLLIDGVKVTSLLTSQRTLYQCSIFIEL
jgi:hypothetical protein